MPVLTLCLSAWNKEWLVIFPSFFILLLLFRTYFPALWRWICIYYICQLSNHAILLWSRYLLLNQWRFYFECRDLNYTVKTKWQVLENIILMIHSYDVIGVIDILRWISCFIYKYDKLFTKNLWCYIYLMIEL